MLHLKASSATLSRKKKMSDPKKQSKKPKKKPNLIDFQKEKSASDFIKSIENESLYEELRPEKKGLTDNIITL